MKRLRSIAFSIAFPLWTGICCIVLAFGPLLPRKGALVMALVWVRSVAWVERHVLGLNYRVIGRENLPAHGAFIVAAKNGFGSQRNPFRLFSAGIKLPGGKILPLFTEGCLNSIPLQKETFHHVVPPDCVPSCNRFPVMIRLLSPLKLNKRP